MPGPAATALLALIRGYKIFISPYFTGSCRFLPSCADYAREAVMRHGALRGGWLSVKRLARCHPFCAAGHDPVPPRRPPLARRPAERTGLARPRREQVARAGVGAGGGAPGR